jgi:uncharacterized glyoxalase superfamily protein PhnB
MLVNRSMPRATVIPVLAYPNLGEAIEWLCKAFDFCLRLRIGNHRAQLNVGDGAIVLVEQLSIKGSQPGELGDSVVVRVADVDGHCERARQRGARIVQAPADHQYGERQYVAEDFAGRYWTFSQSIADVAPEEWGGTAGRL